MPLNIDSVLGVMPRALQLRAQRTEILASNLANSETPGYKAQDFDFKAALDRANSNQLALKVTHTAHRQPSSAGPTGLPLQYRIPNQASLDGNTVDSHMEKSEFAENLVQYQAVVRFLDGRFKGIKSAITGE